MAQSPARGTGGGQVASGLRSQLVRLVDALPNPALLTNNKGGILHCNAPCEQLLRTEAEELHGAVLSPLPADGGPVVDAGLVRVYKGDRDTGTRQWGCRIRGIAQSVAGHHVVLLHSATPQGSGIVQDTRDFLEDTEPSKTRTHPLPCETVAVPIRTGVPSGLVVRVETQEELSLLVRYYRGAPVCVAAGQLLSTVRTVAELAGENFPLVLAGARGTGKRLLAHLVHLWSHRSTQPMAVLSAEHPIWSSDRWPASADETEQHPVLRRLREVSRGTLVLHHAHRLPNEWLNWFRDAVEEGLTGVAESPWMSLRCRLIVTVVPDELPVHGSWRDFVTALGVRLIELEGLNHSPELVPGLAAYFAFQFAFRFRSPVRVVHPDVLDWLQHQRWPGGIRQLRAAVYRACATCRGQELRLEHFLSTMGPNCVSSECMSDPIKATLRALEACGGNRKKAARLLGVSPSTVYRRLRRLREQET